MGKFDAYKLQLKNLADGVHEYVFCLDDKFFKEIDGPEVHKGKVDVHLNLKKADETFELKFKLSGAAILPCDRCLDDIECPIEAENILTVKLGKDFSEDGDVLIVPEAEGELNIAWFLYEFVALEIPLKHVHPAGKCNKKMSSVLRQHSGKHADDDDAADDDFTDESDDFDSTSEPDPRWDELNKLMDNN
ncbi:MAG: DUF177 domain-containing protein [Bacteroidales bacterium]